MKKILFFATALAGLFLAGSCQRENLEPAGNTVTYTVQIPSVTKAIGDGTNVNKVHYEVYRTAEPGTINFGAGDNLLYHRVEDMTAGSADIQLELVKDQNFTVLFWAQHGETNEAYDVTNLTNVTLKPSLNANVEDYAAFSAVDFIEKNDNLADRTVTLYRPVSQLNIGTTAGSLTAFDEVVELDGSSVVVTGLSNTFNVAKQAAGDALTSKFTYAEQDVPTEPLTVGLNNYVYVGMNYVGFAPEVGTTVTVSYVINTSEGDIEHTVENVDMKPNYRTNIIGNLITDASNYIVTLDTDWDEPAVQTVNIVYPGESLQAMVDAVAAPATIYLAEGTHTGHTVINKNIALLPLAGDEVVYDGHLHINNTTAVIKNITLTNEHLSSTTVQASGDAHWSCASSYGSNVTFDNCTFDIKKSPAANKAQYGFYNYQGVSEKIVIKNCTFNCNGERPIYTRTIVEVDGCKFYDQYRYALQVAGELPAQQQVVTFTNNQIINPCVTSGKAFAAGISISGSRTCENVTFNISGNTLTSPLFKELIYVYDNSAKINIASCTVNGATFVREDEVPSTYAAYTDVDLINAEEGAVLVLQNDMDLNFTGVNPQYNPIKASVIDLNGKTLTIKKTDIRYQNTTIMNGNIVVDPSVSSSTAIFYMHNDYTLTLEGVEVEATGLAGTYLIGIEGQSNLKLIDSEITIDNPSLVNLVAAIACNGSGKTTVENSNIYVKNINGRAFLNTSCAVVNSTVTADYVKAGFYIPAGKKLSIDATSTVNITNLVDDKVNGIDLYGDAIYDVANGATVNATVGRN